MPGNPFIREVILGDPSKETTPVIVDFVVVGVEVPMVATLLLEGQEFVVIAMGFLEGDNM